MTKTLNLTPKNLETLGLDPKRTDYNLSEIKEAYRAQSRVKHPDKGGSAEEFQALRQAYEEITKAESSTASSEEPNFASSNSELLNKKVSKLTEEVIKRAIKENTVNSNLSDGDTLLTKAARLYKPACLNELLKFKDLDVNVVDGQGKTALMILASHPNLQDTETPYFKKLLAMKADINTKSHDGLTLLMIIVLAKKLNLLELIINDKRLDILETNNEGYTALDLAKKNNVSDKIITLLTEKSELQYIAEQDIASLISMVPESEISVNKVNLWLNKGMSVNAIITKSTKTNLVMHFLKSNPEIATFLIRNKADLKAVDVDGTTALMIASELKDLTLASSIAEMILKADSSTVNAQDKNGFSALMLAAKAGNEALVSKLLDYKASTTLKTISGRTAADFAADSKNLNIISKLKESDLKEYSSQSKLDNLLSLYDNKITLDNLKDLLKSGYDINSQSESTGKTVLHYFIESKDFEAVDFVLKNKADVNIVDKKGNTPLLMACKLGLDQVVKDLIDNGANINMQDAEGKTPLMISIIAKSEVISKILLDRGADTSIRSHEGKVAEDYSGEIAKNKGVLSSASEFLGISKKDNTVELVQEKTKADIFASGNLDELLKGLGKNKLTLKIAQDWLSKGLDVNSEGKNGITLLTIFAKEEDVDAVEYLLNAGADINHKLASGETILHLAAAVKGVTTTSWMGLGSTTTTFDNKLAIQIMDHHPDFCIRDVDGKLSISIARDLGNSELVSYYKTVGFSESQCSGLDSFEKSEL